MSYKRNALKALQGKLDTNLLPDVRVIEVHYRGCSIKLKVRCLAEEAELRVWTKIKSHAVNAGELPPVYCENDLVDVSSASTGKFHAEVLEDLKAAREAANAAIEMQASKDANSVLDLLQRRESVFAANDRWFSIEMQFLDGMRGDIGAQRHLRKALEILPSPNTRVEVEAALQEVVQLQNTQLHNLCPQSARGSIEVVIEMLKSLAVGRRPAFGICSDYFLRTVKNASSVFLQQ